MLWGLERLIESQRPAMEVIGKGTNCAEAVGAVQRTKPDLVLLDIDLGAENGIDAIGQMLHGGAANVLVLTGVRDPEVHQKAVVAGARGVIGKTENADSILKAIVKVNAGELWLDRTSASRVLAELSRGRTGEKRSREQEKLRSLTARERSIVREFVRDAGATTRTLAERLSITESTLRNHLTSIYDKLDVANRLELLVYVNKSAPASFE
jgi:two-component system, NarL family, nitrate/nitrite response regulator NarL